MLLKVAWTQKMQFCCYPPLFLLLVPGARLCRMHVPRARKRWPQSLRRMNLQFHSPADIY